MLLYPATSGVFIMPKQTEYEKIQSIIGGLKLPPGGLVENYVAQSIVNGRLDRQLLKGFLDSNNISNSLLDQKSPIGPIINSQARNLEFTPERYNKLLDQATSAYQWFIENGPFYGTKKEPSFRLSAEPIILPKNYLDQLQTIGKDIVALDSALAELPDWAKDKLGKDISFNSEPSWRLDIILDENGLLNINEIQVDDGADALMIAEAMAYDLIDLPQSTAAALNKAYRQKLNAQADEKLNLAAIWTNINPRIDPYVSNAQKMARFLSKVSQGKTKLTLIQADENYNPSDFNGVINCCIPPSRLPFQSQQVLSQTNFSAIDNKGVFSLITDRGLIEFWLKTLSRESFSRLEKILIPSKFISTKNNLLDALNDKNSVVKSYWTQGDAELLQSGQGVFGPWSDFRKKWEAIDMFSAGFKFIRQQFITPSRISAVILNGNRNGLEKVNWYNRICAKYVSGQLTAVEMTLGPYIVPTKRDCCFVPIIFK